MNISPKIKVASIVFLLAVVINLMFYQVLWETEIKWISFFLIGALLAIPYYFLFFYVILKENRQDQKKIKEQLKYVQDTNLMSPKVKFFTSIGLGYFFYLISFSCVPFGINYHFTDDQTTSFDTRQFAVQEEDAYSADELINNEQFTYSNIKFYHGGVYFSVRAKKTREGSLLKYKVKRGLFGLNIVTDCEVF